MVNWEGAPAYLGGAGAQSLGTAKGSIVIDTSQAEQAVGAVRRVGQNMAQSLGSASTGVNKFVKDIRSLRSELLMLGTAAAGITLFGLGSAKELRNYRVQFNQLLGDERKAAEVMERLTDQANRFGLEITEVWQLGRALIPVLEDGAASLDVWVKRAALLASTNPLKGTTDAVRAIQEYLAGQPRSLQFLFNVDPNLIQEAKNQYSDVGQQLDYILTRMGATEKGAEQMADAWVSVKNELKLVMATAFTPLLEALQPILHSLAELLSNIRETAPGLLSLGAGFASIVAVGAPLLVFLGQVIGSLQKIKTLIPTIKAAGPALGKLGLYGGAVAAGGAAGIGIVRGIGRATGDERLQNYALKDAWTTVKQAIFVVHDMMTKVGEMVAIVLAKAGLGLADVINSIVETLGHTLEYLGDLLPGEAGKKIGGFGQQLTGFAASYDENRDEWLRNLVEEMEAGRKEWLQGVYRFMFPEGQQPAADTGGGGAGVGTGAAAGIDPEALEVFRQYEEERDQIVEEAASERERIEQESEERRTEIVEDFAQRQAQALEDFNRAQDRSLRDFNRSESRIEEEYYRNRAQRAAEFGIEIQRMEEDHQRQMQRLREDHEARAYDLIAARDALGLIREQRSYERKRRQAEEDYQVTASRRNQDFARELAENEAQFQRAREQRLADFELRRADEQADFDLQRERERKQNEELLAELDQALEKELDLLSSKTDEALALLERETTRRIYAIDAALVASFYTVQDAVITTANLMQWLGEMTAKASSTPVSTMPVATQPQHIEPVTPGLQTGGYAADGLWRLHDREFVLNPDTTRIAEQMVQGKLTQQAILNAIGAGVAGGNGRGQVVYNDRRELRFYGALSAEERQAIRAEILQDTQKAIKAVVGA
jgi:hypothetical protein